MRSNYISINSNDSLDSNSKQLLFNPSPPVSNNNKLSLKRVKDITLIIDDDKICCTFIKKYLNISNINNVSTVNSGIEAVNFMNKNILNINLIIIDYNLQDTNAVQILHVLNDILKMNKIKYCPKIVFISGSSLPKIAEDFCKTNQFNFFKKPINFTDINLLTNDRVKSQRISISYNTIGYLNIVNPIEIESGSFSKCYKCGFNGKTVVMKKSTYKNNDARNNSYPTKLCIIKNLYFEITILEKLRNPYIVEIYNTIIGYDCTLIIMEYCSKGDLYNAIYNNLTIKQIKIILLQISYALQYLHNKQIIHRDIKPENIRISEKGNVKLIDFGFSCYNSGKSICGTLGYMAPEIISSQNYNKSIDYWALGVLLYEMYHKRIPFDDQNYDINSVKFLNEFKKDAKQIYDKLTDFNPKTRIANFKNNLNNIKLFKFVSDIDYNSIIDGILPVFEFK